MQLLNRLYIYGLVLLSLVFYPTVNFAVTSTCDKGVAEPPFLSYGVEPNLLMVIDNSASMWDMAYVEGTGYCTADDFDSATTYAGYFDEGSWYVYNIGTEQFEIKTAGEVATLAAVAVGTPGVKYYFNLAGAGDLNVGLAILAGVDPVPDSVVGFVAKGNFLNWAAASKFDIQKEILTGGKYDAASGQLIMENRGCAGRRFVKEIAVTTNGIDSYSLTLAIRKPNDDEKSDADDNTTRIEIFAVTVDGFDDAACQRVVDAMADGSYTLGGSNQDVKDCLGYSVGSNTVDTESYAAFNHVMQFCWWHSKHGVWPNDNVSDMKNACEGIYDAGVPPGSLAPDDTGYGCYGIYDADPALREGYIGRCWEPAVLGGGCFEVSCDDPDGDGDPLNDTDILPQSSTKPYRDPFCGGDNKVYECVGIFNDQSGNCNGEWKARVKPTGCADALAPPNWMSPVDAANTCIYEAMQDYCGVLEVPEVIDPSDLVSQTSEYANIPAVMIDSGVMSQLNEPLLVLKGKIAASQPTGILQEHTDKMRIGAMIFNENGSAAECVTNDMIECPANNKDGGRILSYIDSSVNNTALVAGINDIKALTWTPLAETLYNAIGYYSQDTGLRLNIDDFLVDADPLHNPIQPDAWCQSNNVLIITEGASTTDLSSAIDALFTTVSPDADADTPGCGALSGSSYLDDLAFYAQNELFGDQDITLEFPNNRNIRTYVVVAGALRVTGTDECSPDVLLANTAANGGTTLYSAENPDELKSKLLEVFSEIRAGASSGSAASVISSSRSGEGAIYQAIFWPEVETADNKTVSWLGEVHSMMIDSWGMMYEDTNGDRTLDTGADQHIIVYYDETVGKSMACYGYVVDGECPVGVTRKDLGDVRYLWSAGNWLANVSPLNSDLATLTPTVASDIYENRTDYDDSDGDYISNQRRRYIFTWNDLNNDGLVDSTEILDFVDRQPGELLATTDWAATALPHAGTRGSVVDDFNAVDSNEVNEIVRWLRGADAAGQRDRTMQVDLDYDGTDDNVTWRLGDVVHSTPTTVSSPAEGYHLLYRDSSYAEFYAHYKNRRHIIYFGANDGMMHAVNGGFYDDKANKFCLTADCNESDLSDTPALGAEMWAYVPYNLQPHLKCLTDLNYADNHKYYVDQRPRIFDVRIFADDADHPNGWGTILVGAMRLGGAKVLASDLNGNGADLREFTSAYFIMDITNPEKPPRLLAEMTRTTAGTEVDLGYTTPVPTMVIMKNGNNTADYSWYLVLGNGPRGVNALDGQSDQNPRISILPLNWLVGGTRLPFRIPATPPTVASAEGGTFELTTSATGFVSDLITVDFNLEADYRADSVYFGTVEGTSAPWSGKMYRLVTQREVGDVQVDTLPSEWPSLLSFSGLDNPNILIDVNQPIVSAAAAAVDPDGNYWIYFGTGRFFGVDDKADSSQQSYYGIKEPMDCDGTIGSVNRRDFTWQTVEKIGASTIPGSQGLVQVDQIQVAAANSLDLAQLSCRDDTTTDCFPFDLVASPNLDDLIDHIVGEGCSETLQDSSGAISDTGSDGWYKNFLAPRERNLGQATLLGGLLTYTTYQPYGELCRSEGLGFLYGSYYQTGTPWFETVFGEDGLEDGFVLDKIPMGRGLTTTPNIFVGESADDSGVRVFLQTSTGEIKDLPQTNLPYKNYKTGRTSWREVSQ